MAIETKKYLDAAGVTTLWGKIQTELNKKGQVNSVSAGNNSVTVGGTASAPTVAVKLSTKDGNQLVLDATSGKEGLYVPAPAAAVVYDNASNYPAHDSLELNIANGVVLTGTDGDIQCLPIGGTANIHDNR